jgi:hypothetical protein
VECSEELSVVAVCSEPAFGCQPRTCAIHGGRLSYLPAHSFQDGQYGVIIEHVVETQDPESVVTCFSLPMEPAGERLKGKGDWWMAERHRVTDTLTLTHSGIARRRQSKLVVRVFWSGPSRRRLEELQQRCGQSSDVSG